MDRLVLWYELVEDKKIYSETSYKTEISVYADYVYTQGVLL